MPFFSNASDPHGVHNVLLVLAIVPIAILGAIVVASIVDPLLRRYKRRRG